jgi:predicted TIM-barrel fold metal-dependent hydrolase
MSSKSRQKIVDAHIHWWDLDNNYYPWLMDNKQEDGGLSGAGPIAHTYVAKHYLEDARGYDISAVVHIEAQWDPSDPLGETRWLDGIARSGVDEGLLAGLVGFANLAADNCEQLLAGHAASDLMRSIRHMLNRIEDNPAKCWAAEDFTVNPAWLKNFGLLKKYKLGFDLMCFSNMMQRMADLAHKHPDTMIYLEHAGMPHEFDAAGNALWRSGMKALAANDNVVTKISGLGTVIPLERSHDPALLSNLKYCVDRVMFASNFPTDKLFSSMDAIWQAFLSITADFSQGERDKMFADNAVKHYRLRV